MRTADPRFRNLTITTVFACAHIGVFATHTKAADPVVMLNEHTLTDYRGAATGVQGVQPQVIQRGTRIDGTSRAGASFPWSLAGNPSDPGGMGVSEVGVDLATGNAPVWDVHIALPAEGFRWIVGTSFSSAQQSSGSPVNSDGYQGKNWFQISQPEIVFYEHTSDDTEDVIYLVYGADRFAEFKRTGTNEDLFRGVNGANGVFLFTAGATNEPDEYTLYSQNGMETTFFGFNPHASPASGQLWKIEDPAGNVAYVGDASTGSTAISDGYDASGRIEYAYDTSDRRYTYAYTTIDSVARLTSVTAETKTGGTWSGTPTGVDEVASVDYGYYQTGDNTYGDNGCLKHVEVTTPLSESGIDDIRETYYRYWKGSYDNATNRGASHHLQYIVEPEGTRRFDYSDSTFDDDFFAATESSLKPYAAAYFEYTEVGSPAELMVDTTWRNGECGCGGGASNGEHSIAYETNSGFSSVPGYDTEWLTRAIVGRPDGSFITRYLDEAGQALSSVVTNITPGSIDGDQSDVDDDDFWVTEITRDSSGFVTAIHTPANITAYTHTNGSVAFTESSSVGVIREFERETGSVHTKGFVEHVTEQAGTSGTAYYVSSTVFAGDADANGIETLDFDITDGTNTVTLFRPKAIERHSYPDYETTALTDTEESKMDMIPAEVSTIDQLYADSSSSSPPVVSTAKNGSGNTVTSTMKYRTDRTVSFRKESDGVINYTQHVNGQAVKSIRDADTSLTGAGQDFEKENAPTGFASDGSGDEFHMVTEMSYDAQGRRETTTMYAGTGEERVTRTHYTRLADRRLVMVSVPREWDNGGTTTYDGPATYSVTNHAGQVEASGTIVLSGGSSTTALTGWIDDTDDDVITAVDTGTLFRLSSRVYDESGKQLDESRMYFDIPATYPGTEGTNYDASYLVYDDMGRKTGSKDATGTISHTVFDSIGRTIESWIGTNDYNDANFDKEFETSGTSDMVRTSLVEYDGGDAGGNSLVTTSTAYVEDSDTDKRVTTFTYDDRHRRVLTTNPVSPHPFVKLDGMGRAIATGLYSDTASIDPSADDPAGTSSDDKLNRIALTESVYDERGRAYETTRTAVTLSTGEKGGTLTTDQWWDDEGRLLKVQGSQFQKYAYDRLGRKTHTYTLGGTNDDSFGIAYATVDDVDGDVVFEEFQSLFDPDTGYLLANVQIHHFHDDYGASEHRGALDSNADGDDLLLTAANVTGRVAIKSYWYDDMGRKTDTVLYGTNGGSDFDRDGLSVPSNSDNTPRHRVTYGDNGLVSAEEDPSEQENRYEYDDAGRRITVIANYVNGSPSGNNGEDDIFTRFAYTDGLMTTLTADLDGDGTGNTDNQVTEYAYGVSKGASAGDSKIGHGRLLQKVTYPDSTSGTDVVTYAYNALGQEIYRKDQAGNVYSMKYDKAGRPGHHSATTIVAGYETDAQRVTTTYHDLGMVKTVSVYNNDEVGLGSILNEVEYSYNGWGELITFQQDRDSAVGAGTPNDYNISYGYASISDADGRQARVRDELTLPNGDVVDFGYNPVDPMDLSLAEGAQTGRIDRVTMDSVLVAEYEYMGTGFLIGTTLPEIDVFRTFAGASSGSYDKLDRFNRVVTDRWTKDLTTDVNIHDLAIVYNRVGNVTSVDDQIIKNSSGNGVFDYEYEHDGLQRLKDAERGHWNGSSISTKEFEETWTMLQTGRWEAYTLDLNGNGTLTDTGDFDETRDYNKVNELIGRDIDADSTDDFNPTHDELGNLESDDENYDYVYDAFGRLRKVKDMTSGDVVSEYEYNGLNWRISAINDSDADGSLADETAEYYAYDESWRLVAVYDGAAAVDEPTEQYLHHNAGLDGRGRSGYLDKVILRDRDTTGGSPDTLDERVYYLHNWRSDTAMLLSAAGEQLETVRYSAYGVPFSLAAGDVKESFGTIDLQDTGQFSNWISTSTYDVRADLDLDGDIDGNDGALIKTSTGGRGALTHPDHDNRLGYAGYVADPDLSGTVWHVRNRVLNSDLGRWLTRDPMGYVDGLDLSEYVGSAPVINADSMGLAAAWIGGYSGGFRYCRRDFVGGCGTASGNCLIANLNDPCILPSWLIPGDDNIQRFWDDCFYNPQIQYLLAEMNLACSPGFDASGCDGAWTISRGCFGDNNDISAVCPQQCSISICPIDPDGNPTTCGDLADELSHVLDFCNGMPWSPTGGIQCGSPDFDPRNDEGCKNLARSEVRSVLNHCCADYPNPADRGRGGPFQDCLGQLLRREIRPWQNNPNGAGCQNAYRDAINDLVQDPSDPCETESDIY